jgi:hypothetical protein
MPGQHACIGVIAAPGSKPDVDLDGDTLKVTAPSLGKAGRTVVAASSKVKSSSQVARVENGRYFIAAVRWKLVVKTALGGALSMRYLPPQGTDDMLASTLRVQA